MNIKTKGEIKGRSFYCFAESFIYTGLVYFIFFYLSPFKHGFLELNLHPLLIVVAVISMRYGTYLSTFGVIFATFFYFLAYLNVERDPIIFFASFEYSKFILMFFFTALFIGKLRDSTDEKIIHMENEISRLKKGFTRQKRNNIKLTFTNSRLKNQIINSKESILTLHHLTSSLDKMGVEEIFTKTILNIKQFIDCDVISIYTYNSEKNFARLKLKVGNGRLPSFFQIEEGEAHKQVIDAREAMAFPLDIEGDTPVYIAPVVTEGKIIGFINVERLSFSIQERYTFEMFKVISHWLNRSLVRAIKRQHSEEVENIYEGTRILKMDYFNKRLEEENNRKKLFKMEFLAFEGNHRGAAPHELHRMIEGRVRDEDVVGMDDRMVRFIFPATEVHNKGLLLDKLGEVIEGIDFYEI
ncbi:hypothetical protein [Propionigenium maris]|nr:hypothetical protein [Propionigenium maris]